MVRPQQYQAPFKLPRVHIPNGYHHVICRANHQERLFATGSDRDTLNEIIADAVGRFGIRVHGYCWMSNHLHFIIQIADQPLGKIMQRIQIRYARYRHRLMNVTGHLFEKPYIAKVVDADHYFQELVRYLHLNPVYAGIVHDPADYLWSSHRAYLGQQYIPWLTTDFGLSFFGHETDLARAQYQRFIQKAPGAGYGSGFAGVSKDPRVLGSDDFAAKLSIALPPEAQEKPGLEDFAAAFCAEQGLPLELLCSLSRAHRLSDVRRKFARAALMHVDATSSDIARFLNRTPSALCQLLAKAPSV